MHKNLKVNLKIKIRFKNFTKIKKLKTIYKQERTQILTNQIIWKKDHKQA